MNETTLKDKIDPIILSNEPVWFIELDGGNEGPVTEDDIRLMIRSGEAAPEAKVWKEGMPHWIPARDTYRFRDDVGPQATDKPLESGSESDDEALTAEEREKLEQHKRTEAARLETIKASDPNLHGGWRSYAWRRWVGRSIDFGLYGLFAIPAAVWGLLTLIESGTIAHDTPLMGLWSALLFLGMALSIDAVVQGLFGNTIGKRLMGLKLVDMQGEALPFGRTLGRNVHVAFFGLGAGIPLVTLIANAVQANRIRTIGMAGYDKTLDTRVAVQSDRFVMLRALGGLALLIVLWLAVTVASELAAIAFATS